MTLWDLRENIEKSIPAWWLLVYVGLIILVVLAIGRGNSET